MCVCMYVRMYECIYIYTRIVSPSSVKVMGHGKNSPQKLWKLKQDDQSASVSKFAPWKSAKEVSKRRAASFLSQQSKWLWSP